MTPAVSATPIQAAVTPIPPLLTDAAAIDALTMILTPRVTLSDVTQAPAPPLVTSTRARLTRAVLATREAAHTEAAIGPGPLRVTSEIKRWSSTSTNGL